MRYYSNPAAAFEVVAGWLPTALIPQSRRADTLAYLAKLPQEFVASEFGFEIYLQSDQIDIGYSYPLTMERSALLPSAIRELEDRIGRPSQTWRELREIARRIARMPSHEGLKGFSVGVDGTTLSADGCPALVYLSFIRSAVVHQGQPFAPPSIDGAIQALLPGAPPSEIQVLDLLQRLKGPSHRLAQVGVSLGNRRGELRFFVAGTVSDQVELLAALDAGHRRAARILEGLRDEWAAWRSGLLLKWSGERVVRIDVEIYPAKGTTAGGPSPVQVVCDTEHFRNLVPRSRRAALSTIAERGGLTVTSEEVAPVSIWLNHIKFTDRSEADDGQWKTYIACRQARCAEPGHQYVPISLQ